MLPDDDDVDDLDFTDFTGFCSLSNINLTSNLMSSFFIIFFLLIYFIPEGDDGDGLLSVFPKSMGRLASCTGGS